MAGPQEQQLQLEGRAGLHCSAPLAEFCCGLSQSSWGAREMGSPDQVGLLGAHSRRADCTGLVAAHWREGLDQLRTVLVFFQEKAVVG